MASKKPQKHEQEDDQAQQAVVVRKTTAVAVPSDWEAELAAQAAAAADQEAGVAGGQFFSVKNGQLSFNGNDVEGNEMAVIILDSVLENVYYEGRFDPNNPTPPTCFAFGRSEAELAPHEVVVFRQDLDEETGEHTGCAGCPMNQWASSEYGDGKACKNTRRLALLPAGQLVDGEFEPETDPEYYQGVEAAFLKLPVTSVRAFAAYVKGLVAAYKRPPHGVVTKISVVPDTKSQFKFNFAVLGLIDAEHMPIIMARHAAMRDQIDFPYTPKTEDTPAPTKRGKPAPAPVRKAAPATKKPAGRY